MKISNEKFVCACCNEVKGKMNKVYCVWDENTIGGKRNNEREDYAICKTCNANISKAGFFGIKQYLKRG